MNFCKPTLKCSFIGPQRGWGSLIFEIKTMSGVEGEEMTKAVLNVFLNLKFRNGFQKNQIDQTLYLQNELSRENKWEMLWNYRGIHRETHLNSIVFKNTNPQFYSRLMLVRVFPKVATVYTYTISFLKSWLTRCCKQIQTRSIFHIEKTWKIPSRNIEKVSKTFSINFLFVKLVFIKVSATYKNFKIGSFQYCIGICPIF